jgi:hypothetical protein
MVVIEEYTHNIPEQTTMTDNKNMKYKPKEAL